MFFTKAWSGTHFCNFTFAIVYFREIPKRGEWIVTARLKRLVKEEGWRGDKARSVCENLLEPYDHGHCA